MNRHLLRLVWNRKRSTALLLVELFVTFLVVALVSTTALYQIANWNRPLGYDWRGVLAVTIDYKQSSDDSHTSAQAEGFARLLAEVASLPEVDEVAGTHVLPFEMGSMQNVFESSRGRIESYLDEVTDPFDRVLGLQIVAGRWFSRDDDGSGVEPIVVDRELAEAMFGSAEAALGQSMGEDFEGPSGGREPRVIGVVSDFRSGGELAGPANFYFRRMRPGDTGQRPLRHLVLRTRVGTGPEFEERLARRLAQVAPDWSFEVRPLAELRRSNLRLRSLPLIAGGIVGSFLLAMVALGLAGVVWQNVIERTREIGLRRALGATGAEVHHQFVWEILLLSAVALAAGILVVLQLPLLNLLGAVRPTVLAAGLGVAIVLLGGLAALSAWLPSRLASRVPPSEALRYE